MAFQIEEKFVRRDGNSEFSFTMFGDHEFVEEVVEVVHNVLHDRHTINQMARGAKRRHAGKGKEGSTSA